MSRYVDLDGLTWDGKTIASKVQEVQTKHGYMQGITVGWLWGDNVPHIDLIEYEAKIRAEFANKLLDALRTEYYYPTQSFEDGVIEVVKDAIHDIEQKEQKI